MADNQFVGNIIPIRFVMKYQPPIIGLVYKRSENDQKKRLYEIHLNNLVFVQNPIEVSKQLFLEHPLFLNQKIISLQQVSKLVQTIQDKLINDMKEQGDDDEQYNQYEDQYTD